MTEQFDPGRQGFRGVLRGPAVATITHSVSVQERYRDDWSRLWAISHDETIIPDNLTGGWWLLAEFTTRQECRDYFDQLCHVFSGATTLGARRRRAEAVREYESRPRCPDCGSTSIMEAAPIGGDRRESILRCSECGCESGESAFMGVVR
jgi:ribosomal protein L37AE/L43A